MFHVQFERFLQCPEQRIKPSGEQAKTMRTSVELHQRDSR